MSHLVLESPNTRKSGLSSGVIKRFEKQIKNESAPLLDKLYTWLHLLKFIDEAEERLLDDEKNEGLREIHRNLTETSIVLGECLLREEGIEKTFNQMTCTRGDFEAKIIMLRYKVRMWHGDLSSEKSKQVLTTIFSGLS